ncbi:MAG: hypothetical protein MI799_24835, partial [Desulfobacterales bacterium]|nr:hypothetical protein [Desulfobacterales bacterium]
MRYWICMDDTDMPGTKGTGWLVQEICRELEAFGLGKSSAVSRHQLFVHKDIPFTSHNSAMCFEIELGDQDRLTPVMDHLVYCLEPRSQPGSDPGLCVTGPLKKEAQMQLSAFGARAKQAVCTKDDAYCLAQNLGIHLSEHGGTGDGIIGALAGIGLRMTGNDGRYRGWYHLGNPGDIVTVADLCTHPFIDTVVQADGSELPPSEKVMIGSEKTKTVRIGFHQVVTATANETAEQTG